MTALGTLLAGIVDYAGLFPPAALDMPAAVRNYAEYRASDDAWMLGRFVVQAARLSELARVLETVETPAGPWHVSALLGAAPADDIARLGEFAHAARGRAVVDSLEAKASDAEGIERIAVAARGARSVFVEIPAGGPIEDLVQAIARAGLHAKIRTGGVTPDAFPSAEAIARFMRACVNAKIAFKATAGLHHPIRASYRLTYEPDAPVGTMFGFLNVFLAAAAIARGAPDPDALALLTETRPEAFTITERDVAWRALRFDTGELRAVRDRIALSFGSCSFREPVDDLRALSLLATT